MFAFISREESKEDKHAQTFYLYMILNRSLLKILHLGLNRIRLIFTLGSISGYENYWVGSAHLVRPQQQLEGGSWLTVKHITEVTLKNSRHCLCVHALCWRVYILRRHKFGTILHDFCKMLKHLCAAGWYFSRTSHKRAFLLAAVWLLETRKLV